MYISKDLVQTVLPLNKTVWVLVAAISIEVMFLIVNFGWESKKEVPSRSEPHNFYTQKLSLRLLQQVFPSWNLLKLTFWSWPYRQQATMLLRNHSTCLEELLFSEAVSFSVRIPYPLLVGQAKLCFIFRSWLLWLLLPLFLSWLFIPVSIFQIYPKLRAVLLQFDDSPMALSSAHKVIVVLAKAIKYLKNKAMTPIQYITVEVSIGNKTNTHNVWYWFFQTGFKFFLHTLVLNFWSP